MSIDWLFASGPVCLKVVCGRAMGLRTDAIELSRGAKLQLALNAKGDLDPAADKPFSSPGTLVVGHDLEVIVEQLGAKGVLRGASRQQMSVGRRGIEVAGRANQLTVELSPEGEEAAIAVEWVCQVPRLMWPARTDRVASEGCVTRERGLQCWTYPGEYGPPAFRGFSFDHAALPIGHSNLAELIVGSVHKSVAGSEVNDAGFVEYRRGPSGLPGVELRRTVRAALEFAFGRGVGVLGYSEFDFRGKALRASVDAPWFAGGLRAPHPPVAWSLEAEDSISEESLAEFVRRYIENERRYELSRAVWLMAYSRSAPADMAAGYLGSAFELLRRNYYRQPAHEARSKHLEATQWKSVRKALFHALEQLADDSAEGAQSFDAIRSGIHRLNEVSGTKLNERLLVDLQLGFGACELEGLRARNDAAHANPIPGDDIVPLIRKVAALETLVARVIIALLDLETYYIDYSALGHLLTPLREPQAGNAFP